MSITMADIAKAAHASVATVGRVLHNNGYVSSETRARIERAIAELGYIPNQNARTLKSNRSGIIGSLVTQNPNSLYYRINESIMQAAHARGFEYLTMECQAIGRDEGRLIDNFIGLRVDGLVITSNSAIQPDMFARLRKAGIPAVAVERGYLEQGIDSLITEDFAGVRDAVARIASRGHRRIGLIAMKPFHDVERQRLAGYRQAIADSGLTADEALIQIVPSYHPQSGRAATEALLSLTAPPTAIFATADTLAAGAMQALYDRHLRVPDDMSIVGYDDVLSQSLSPQIDSVGLVLTDIGDHVMQLLLDKMADADRPAERRSISTVYADRGTVRQL